jgi:sulfonate transport system permease protein
MVQLDTNPSLTRDSSRVTVTRTAKYTVEQRDKKQRRTVILGRIGGISLPVVLLLLWEAGVALNRIDARFYPPPTEILNSLRSLLGSRLPSDTWITLTRVMKGYLLGSTVGCAIGLLTGSFRAVRSFLESTLSAIYVIPNLALLPILILIFGIGDRAMIALCALSVFFYVWIGVMEAVVSVPNGYREAARSFEVTRRQMFLHVTFPATLPRVFVALRIGIGIAILVIIVSEFVIGRTGLGFLIFNSRLVFQNGAMFVGILAVAVLGLVAQALMLRVSAMLTPWQRKSSS